jgi:glycine/D-amino acid oxidase-like deaminating enzyme/nitrite reductase/ring-hydroxylating ferredoxin subunit
MNTPYWILSSEGKTYETLDQDHSTDYLVIGGGLLGVTCLYLLSKAGQDVTLIDANRIGYGTSGRNTGKLTAQHGNIYSSIEKNYGIEKAKEYYKINMRAIQFIEDRIKEFNIDCQFKRLPAYLYTQDSSSVAKLDKEFDLYQRIGIDCSYEKEAPIPLKVLAALKMNNQAQFHPKQYLDALAEQCTKQKGRIFENTRVTDFHPGKECIVELKNNKKIAAKNVIIASHYPCYDGKGFYFARLKPERSYIIGVELEEFYDAHFINIENPTRSLRFIPEEKVLMIAGQDHKVGHNDDDHYEILKIFARDVFKTDRVKYQWSAQDYKTHDYIPYAGYLNYDYKNIYVGTGFNKWGLSQTTACALVIYDLIEEETSLYEELYCNKRVNDIININFLKENVDMAIQWIGGKLRIGNTQLPDEKGVGEIVNINGKRCGFYRDEEDNIYIVDTTCPHMACELRWNSQEKSWDCPCHGSRFDYKGNVLEGPAEYSLNSYHEPKNKVNPQIK